MILSGCDMSKALIKVELSFLKTMHAIRIISVSCHRSTIQKFIALLRTYDINDYGRYKNWGGADRKMFVDLLYYRTGKETTNTFSFISYEISASMSLWRTLIHLL